MSSRPIFAPYQAIVSGDMSADVTSDVTIIQNVSMFSYDVSWTGSSPVGTLTVQVSNTYKKNAAGAVAVTGNWTDMPLTTSVSGNSGTAFLDCLASSTYAVRLKYTRVSGSGTLNATINGKVA